MTDSFKTAAISRGHMDMSISSQWNKRGEDERFENLVVLETFKHLGLKHMVERKVQLEDIEFDHNDNVLHVLIPGTNIQLDLTNWAFSQLCGWLTAPSAHYRAFPAIRAADNLNYWARNSNDVEVKIYYDEKAGKLHAVTGPNYGRVHDYSVVQSVREIAGDGVSKDALWRVPGSIDWSSYFRSDTVRYSPAVSVDKQNTTLYASDRDMFLFLVDDHNPIEIGKLPNGDSDLVFRGFNVSNSEVGKAPLEFRTMLLRGVCMNRCLWGVEASSIESLYIKHTKRAPEYYRDKLIPILNNISLAGSSSVLETVNSARAIKFMKDEDRLTFLTGQGFTLKQAIAIQKEAYHTDQTPPDNLWLMVNAITAWARTKPYQDQRWALEQQAGQLLKGI